MLFHHQPNSDFTQFVSPASRVIPQQNQNNSNASGTLLPNTKNPTNFRLYHTGNISKTKAVCRKRKAVSRQQKQQCCSILFYTVCVTRFTGKLLSANRDQNSADCLLLPVPNSRIRLPAISLLLSASRI